MSGRELSAPVAALTTVVAVVGLGGGSLLTVAGAAGYPAGAWASPEPLSRALIGAARVGVAPALFTLRRAATWEEARRLYPPLVVVVGGPLAVVGCLAAQYRKPAGKPSLTPIAPFAPVPGWLGTGAGPSRSARCSPGCW